MDVNSSARRFYGALYEKHGATPQAFDWSGREAQFSRFEVLTGILRKEEPRGFSVLDVGCGFGDLYAFLREQGLDVAYTGVDLMPDFIEVAGSRWPSAQFRSGDFLEMGFDKAFDYVFCSGTLNYLVEDALGWAKRMLEAMIRAARIGVSVNMTSKYTDADYRNDHTLYADPAEIFTFCRERARYVTILHHYRPNDFTVYVLNEGVPNGSLRGLP